MLLFALLLAVGIFVALFVIGLSADTVSSEITEIISVLMLIGIYVVSALGLSTLYQAVVSALGLAADGGIDRIVEHGKARAYSCGG